MRIWFVEIGEPLPLEPGARLLRYGHFTAWLSAQGHEVTWWTCDFSHAAKASVAKPGEHRLADGLRLMVLPGLGYRSNTSPARFRHHRDFARKLAAAIQAEAERPDIIICPIPTVENAGVIAAYARKHNIPWLLDIRDHWPDDLVKRFPGPARWLARAAFQPMYSTARRAAREATAITGVTRLQRDYGLSLAGREATDRDRVFYIGYTRQTVDTARHAAAQVWWREQGLRDDATVAAFAGTIGVSFDFSPILAAAHALSRQGRRDIQFVIAGDGGARSTLVEQAGDLAGDLILIPGWIDLPRIDALLSRSRMALAPYIPNTSMSLPNKFYEYMAYGLPILSSCTGESEQLLREHHFGIQYDPADRDFLLASVVELADNPPAQARMAEAALALFKGRFDQATLFPQMESHMKALAGFRP